MAFWSRPSEAVSSEPASRVPASIAVADVLGRLAGAAVAPSSVHSSSSVGLSTAVGIGIGSPAKRGDALAQLRGEVSWRQREPWETAALDAVGQVDDQADEFPLQVDRGCQVGSDGDEWRPIAPWPRQARRPRARRKRDVRHAGSMV